MSHLVLFLYQTKEKVPKTGLFKHKIQKSPHQNGTDSHIRILVYRNLIQPSEPLRLRVPQQQPPLQQLPQP